MKTDSLSNSMRWVILLLMAAVILPTVCLLWFMMQAMRNVRMAAHSQLSSVCRSEVSRVYGPFLEWINTETQQARAMLAQKSPHETYVQIAQNVSAFGYEGLFIIDQQSGQMLYPSLFMETDATDALPELAEAVRLEFAEQDIDAALAAYRRILADYSDYERTGEIGSLDPVLYKRCKLAEARLLERQGHVEAAISMLECVQRQPLDDAANWYYYTTANLKILDLLAEQGFDRPQQAQRLNERVENLVHVLGSIDFLSSDQRLMAYDKVRDLSQRKDLLTRSVERELGALERRMEVERNSLDFLSRRGDFLTPPSQRLFEKIAGTDLYAFTLHAGPVRVVKVIDAESVVRKLSGDLNLSEAIVCRVMNPQNEVIAGPENIEQAPFLAFPIAPFFDWTAAFYEADADGNIFEAAARRQTVIYLWTGVLVAAMVTVTGVAAVRTVGRQIRTNRLKNDFIATVTHELKTPLASMRVLVDTLLDKRYTDESTADEYLRMIANENKRLTHLIDSFLTFSRMERNKQVFDFQATRPAEIAAGAVEAMSTKLSNHGCDFKVTVDENLPAVYADRDAMITVLVNLLDNACKYGKNDKRIQLRVYAENGSVCFAVEDNGIGISRRQQKKIFSRFYQADSRLSRSVEGCGLGLSIVKFIVDAHKGTIEVDSQVGEGSSFTVRLTAIDRS